MLIVRLAKVAMTAALAAFAFIVTYDNIVDYGTNYEFVKHVLSMDTTFPGNTLMGRAITDPRIWTIGYGAIIAAEGVVFILLAVATFAMLMALRAPAASFQRAKVWLVAGVDGRLHGLVLRLHGGGRRVFCDVAIQDLERAGSGLPVLRDAARGADFRQSEGRRTRLTLACPHPGFPRS